MAMEPALIIIPPEKTCFKFLYSWKGSCSVNVPYNHFQNVFDYVFFLTSTLNKNVKQIVYMVIAGTILLWEQEHYFNL